MLPYHYHALDIYAVNIHGTRYRYILNQLIIRHTLFCFRKRTILSLAYLL